MRILFIAFDSEELSIRLASAVADDAEVCLMLPRRRSEGHLQWLGPKVRFEPFEKPRLREPVRQIRTMFSIIRRIRRFRPDVIHFQKQHLWFNLALLLLREYPLVVSIHDPEPHLGDKNALKTPRMFWELGYRRADRVIAHNQSMKKVIIERLGIDPAGIDVVPLVERGDEGAQRETSEEEDLVLFFGRIWAYKGLDYLIRAEPLISSRVPQAKIVIAGRGDDFAPYRRLMKNPQRFIVHNEFVSDEKRAELFRRACVVVLPYVEATQSGVIPVAYTYGKPVVATAVGGLPEQVEHGRTGLLVPPQNESALAEAIVSLLQDKSLRRQLGVQGQQKARNEWSAEAVAAKTLSVYRRTIEAVKQTPAARRKRRGRSWLRVAGISWQG